MKVESKPIRICLLGSFAVSTSSKTVTHFRTRQTAQLLAYIALNQGRTLLRREVAETIWPGAELQAQLQSLRTALHWIRQSFGNVVLSDKVNLWGEEYLITTDVQEVLNGGSVELLRGSLLADWDDDWVRAKRFEVHKEIVNRLKSSARDIPKEDSRVVYELLHRFDPADLELRGALRGSSPNVAPQPFNLFVGRTKELEEIERYFYSSRVVTLTGPGGIGKSRLAVEYCRLHHPHTWFVPLADVTDPGHVFSELRTRLGLPPSPGVSARNQVLSTLAAESGTLVLDNFEHLLDALSVLSDLLDHCPRLNVLITSQVATGIGGEVEMPVGPLCSPVGEVSDGAKLFIDRAGTSIGHHEASKLDIALVEKISHILDGFPLAIEICAAKCVVYSLDEILEQLADRFEFLESEGPTSKRSHRSLRMALDWSYERLPVGLQELCLALSVFRGTFDVDSALAVTGKADAEQGVVQLYSIGWILRETVDRRIRFRMLESVRRYCLELITPSTLRKLERDHASYFVSFAEKADDQTFTPGERQMHANLARELHNLNIAYLWCVDHYTEGALHITRVLNWFWVLRGMASTGEAMISSIWEKVDKTPRVLLGWTANYRGNLLLFQGKLLESFPWYEEAHSIGAQVGDQRIIGSSLIQRGICHAELLNFERARDMVAKGLEVLVQHGDPNWIGPCYTLSALGYNRERGRVSWHWRLPMKPFGTSISGSTNGGVPQHSMNSPEPTFSWVNLNIASSASMKAWR